MPRFDLIILPSPSLKVLIMGGKNYWKSGVQIFTPEGKFFFVPFSFHFQILHIKLGIFDFNSFFDISFYCLEIKCLKCFIDIWLVKQDIKIKDMHFLRKIWKWIEKGENLFWPSGAGIRTPDFQKFSRPQFELSRKARVTRSNQKNLLNEIQGVLAISGKRFKLKSNVFILILLKQTIP